MAEFPRLFALPDPLAVISVFSVCSLGGSAFNNSNPTGVAYPSSNLAIFVPFRLSRPITVSTMFYENNGATGNVDLGIYSADGTRLVSSGSTVQAGGTTLQTITITSTRIGPGLFYLAVAADNTGAFVATQPGVQVSKILGMAQMASAFPLPATATFATITNSFLPMMGVTGRSVV